MHVGIGDHDCSMACCMPCADIAKGVILCCDAGPEVSGAITNDGRAWLWGMNTNGQLGKGTNDDADEAVSSACLHLYTCLIVNHDCS